MVLHGEQLRALNTYTKLMRCSETVTARLHQHLSRVGLTSSQFGVLEALHHLGPLCMKDLSQKLLKTGGNLTMVVNNLEKRALVTRQLNRVDRRYVTVDLTETGQSLIRKVLPMHGETAVNLFSNLKPTEMTHLGDLLKKLGKAAQESVSLKA